MLSGRFWCVCMCLGVFLCEVGKGWKRIFGESSVLRVCVWKVM